MKINVKSPEFAWVWAFGAIFTGLFFHGSFGERIWAIGMSVVFNAYPLSRSVFKIGRANAGFGFRTSEFKTALALFVAGLAALLGGIVTQESGALMMVSASAVFVFGQGFSQKLNAVRTQVLLR